MNYVVLVDQIKNKINLTPTKNVFYFSLHQLETLDSSSISVYRFIQQIRKTIKTLTIGISSD